MADNEGAWIDESGEVDDWVELVNVGSAPLDLADYSIGDAANALHPLPDIQLFPGQVILFWADGEPEEGLAHLPFKLSSAGETVYVQGPDGFVHDQVTYPAMAENDAYARFDGTMSVCAWSTPGETNGTACTPPPPEELPTTTEFAPYTWPEPWPDAPTGLVIAELALNPASFIEVYNASSTTADLTGFSLRIAATAPGLSWPTEVEGTLLSWPTTTLAPGQRLSVSVTAPDTAAVSATTDFEGVVTLFEGTTVVDRVDFMSWPAGTALARTGDTGRMRLCENTTSGATNTCTPVAQRTVGERLRHLYTEGDFDALAEGGAAVGIAPVKFVVDMDAGDVVHLLSAARWDLHYRFVREQIDGDPPLDRCDPVQEAEFRQGWYQFSVDHYFNVEGRRYLLGTLAHHLGPDLRTVEHATGDYISPAQMKKAFFTAMRHVVDPKRYYARPQSPNQTSKLLAVDGELPIVDTNAVFQGVELQLLAEGVAYGTLEFVAAQDLTSHALGPRAIIVTDRVPNDIALVGGLITEDLQTPLAHVNVLSRNRGTPNMGLVGARTDPRLENLWGQLVRFQVTPTEFTIDLADPAEAQAFWDEQSGNKPLLTPRINTAVRGLQLLSGLGIEDTPSLGAKAAQLAELASVNSARSSCPGPLTLPQSPAAIPVVHSLEHFSASGATARLAELQVDPNFVTDPLVRASGLAEVRALIDAHPVDAALVAQVTSYTQNTFGTERVRFRSSSNTEDLQQFSGAGLYTSKSAVPGDLEKTIENAIRAVWASQYYARAYDERRYANVEESAVAMGILVHASFVGEQANIVAISRNIAVPIRGDQYSVNAQFGEASVVKPAAGITTDQLLYRWYRNPRIVYSSYSNLPRPGTVLTAAEVERLTCQLRAVHDHFKPLIDPTDENHWFAMDTEAKLIGPSRTLFFKQARPYSFGEAERPTDCREF
jgi:hypothetical protein